MGIVKGEIGETMEGVMKMKTLIEKIEGR